MKFVRKEKQNNKDVIVMETNFLFFKKETKYIADRVTIPGEYWSWYKLPNLCPVYDALSFQLDSLNRNK